MTDQLAPTLNLGSQRARLTTIQSRCYTVVESLVCNFYLSVAAPVREIHSHVTGTLSNQQTTITSPPHVELQDLEGGGGGKGGGGGGVVTTCV